MTQDDRKSAGKAMTRPALVAVAAIALILGAIWLFGPTPYSETNPYQDDLAQNPTGAGSNPDGVAIKTDDGVPVERDNDELLDGSTDAADLTGITGETENTVADEGRRLLQPDEAVSPEAGDVNNETGMVEDGSTSETESES